MVLVVFVISLWVVVSLGSVTLTPTSCARSKTYTYSISTIDSIVTLCIYIHFQQIFFFLKYFDFTNDIDAHVSDTDKIIMMPPTGTGTDVVIETTIYSGSLVCNTG
jgi:hypothetical protein